MWAILPMMPVDYVPAAGPLSEGAGGDGFRTLFGTFATALLAGYAAYALAPARPR